MAEYEITGPDGTTYTITAPDSATEAEALAYFRQEFEAGAPQQQAGAPEPEGVGKYLSMVDDVGRGAADFLTMGYADEIAAALSNLTGIGQQDSEAQTYQESLAAEQKRDTEANPYARLLGQVSAGVAAPISLAKAGYSLINLAKPTVSKMAGAAALEGGIYGGLYGTGSAKGGVEERLKGGLEGAAWGAGIGGGLGLGIGQIIKRVTRSKIPTTEGLRAEGDALFKAADESGLVLTAGSFDKAVDDIAVAVTRGGIDRGVQPKSWAVLQRLISEKGAPKTLQEITTLRRVAAGAAKSIDPDEARIASMIIDDLDDYLARVREADVISGNPKFASETVTAARSVWARMRKSEAVDDLVDRAGITAGQFTGSGYENALRTEFRALAKNKKKLRGFNQSEVRAIKKIASGGAIDNMWRFVGKFAPHGVVSTGMGAGIGFAIGGPAGAVAVPAIGEVARRVATGRTFRNVRDAGDLIRSGGKFPLPAPLTAKQRALAGGGIGLGSRVPGLLER